MIVLVDVFSTSAGALLAGMRTTGGWLGEWLARGHLYGRSNLQHEYLVVRVEIVTNAPELPVITIEKRVFDRTSNST